MIVLRITLDGNTETFRSAKREILVGSTPDADLRQPVAVWPERLARLHHRGTEVHIEALAGGPSQSLRLGGHADLGRARIELVGLLPLAAEAGPALAFGGYDSEDLQDQQPSFTLADEPPAPSTTETTSHTFRSTPPPATPKPPAAKEPVAPAAGKKNASAGRPAREANPSRSAPGTKQAGPKPTKHDAEAKTESRADVAAASAAEADRLRTARALRGSSDFSAEFYSSLRRSPFFAVSFALHFLIFLILTLLPIEEDQSRATGKPAVQFGEIDDDETIMDSADRIEDPVPETAAELDLPEFELPEENPFDDPDPDNRPEERADAPSLAELPMEEIKPVDVGLAPRLTSFRNRTRRPPAKVKKQDLERRVLKGGAEELNRRSAQIVRGAVGLGPGGGTRGILPRRSEVLVVEGAFDSMQKVLDELKIQHVKASPLEVVRGKKYNLSQFKMIFWNCGEGMPEAWMVGFRSKLKRWIRGGGYLFSTDWAIGSVVAPMFPKLVRTSGQRAPLSEMVLHIQPTTTGARHNLLRGVFQRSAKGQWWLEQASFDIQVKDPRRVETLIEAPALKDAFRRSSAVAITFTHGKGRVLHVLGHYYQKMGNLAGTLAAHRLALNLMIDRVKNGR